MDQITDWSDTAFTGMSVDIFYSILSANFRYYCTKNRAGLLNTYSSVAVDIFFLNVTVRISIENMFAWGQSLRDRLLSWRRRNFAI